MIENISTPELAWSLLAMLGLAVSLIMLGEVFADYRFVKISGQNGALRLIAGQHVRSELRRVLEFVGFLALGVAAGLTPPPIREDISNLATIFSVVFFGVELINLIDSLLDYRDRVRLITSNLSIAKGKTEKTLSEAIDAAVEEAANGEPQRVKIVADEPVPVIVAEREPK